MVEDYTRMEFIIEVITNIFWRKKDNHFCRKFNSRSSNLLLAFILLVFGARWSVTCARLIRFGDGSGICTSSDSENVRRKTEGKPGSSTLGLVELWPIIKDGGIHLAQSGSHVALHDVAYSYDDMSASPVDEIPIMVGICFCLHSLAFTSWILIHIIWLLFTF
jgi:hypothetical protein